MPDILLIVPARGCAGRLGPLTCGALGLSELATDVVVAVDDDDPDRDAYLQFLARMPVRCRTYPGPAMSFTGWANRIALEAAGRYRAVAALGRDHLPQVPGWDALMLGAIGGGTGIALGEGTQGVPLVTSDIVQALGWLLCPEADRDDGYLILRDIALAAGCLAPLRTTVIDQERQPAPGPGYAAWREGRMEADAATVRALLKVPAVA